MQVPRVLPDMDTSADVLTYYLSDINSLAHQLWPDNTVESTVHYFLPWLLVGWEALGVSPVDGISSKYT